MAFLGRRELRMQEFFINVTLPLNALFASANCPLPAPQAGHAPGG